jgi:hypothetical protein
VTWHHLTSRRKEKEISGNMSLLLPPLPGLRSGNAIAKNHADSRRSDIFNLIQMFLKKKKSCGEKGSRMRLRNLKKNYKLGEHYRNIRVE